MTLALATRGYLQICPRGELPNYGPGPRIVGISPTKPTIEASAVTSPPAPTIVGAAVKGPQITSASSTATPRAGPTPVITGAGVLKPDIDSAEEE